MSLWGRAPAWMNRELFLRLQEKRRTLFLWKKGWEIQGEYREVLRICREKIRRVKTQPELNLTSG